MAHPDIDTLIIGQGLAGSLLAWELAHHNERILVIDEEHAGAASTAAAGLINPVTGQRLVKDAGVDDYLPLAHQRYRALEKLLGRRLLVEKPMWRLLRNEKERQVWQTRSEDAGYRDYLGEWLESEQLQPPFVAPLGGFVQHRTAYLNINALLEGVRDYLVETGRYRPQRFDYDALVLEDEQVRFDGIRCGRVIFCEGYRAIHNPWFNWLPFTPAKGEILSLRFEQKLPDVMINAERWLIPRGNGEYRLGATYEHQQLEEGVTAAARQTLLDALPRILVEPHPYRVTGQQAGVRPATTDRQPFIGMHPRWPQLGIFNGFGSKGSMLIPWHATAFADALHCDCPLPIGCDIRRHLQLYRG
ncbi:MAG: FAD-binding oxidoreductase [Gammaproteobacteria bacterium]|nr:FAD-binding oxidoreductase [Gammaproteobacteria bacterium]